jgi:hypothetical protein
MSIYRGDFLPTDGIGDTGVFRRALNGRVILKSQRSLEAPVLFMFK